MTFALKFLINNNDQTEKNVEETADENLGYNYKYDFHTNEYYDNYLQVFLTNKEPVEIVFAGDSITSRFQIDDFWPNEKILNRGIGSDVSAGLLARMDEILSHNPKKIFVLIGINGCGINIDPEETCRNLEQIINKCIDNGAEIYILSILPVVEERISGNVTNKDISNLNDKYRRICVNMGANYLDIYTCFVSKDGIPIEDLYLGDGIHLSSKGFFLMYNQLKAFVY